MTNEEPLDFQHCIKQDTIRIRNTLMITCMRFCIFINLSFEGTIFRE